MKETTIKKIYNVIVFLILAILAIAVLYAAYLEMVEQGKADRIEILRERLNKQTGVSDDITEQSDSVISIFQDSAHEITTR